MSNRALADLAMPFLSSVLLFREAPSARRPSASELHRELSDSLAELERQASAEGMHGDEIEEARFALSVWADEIVMADPDRQADWFERQLQFEGFGVRDGGARFYSRMEGLRPDFHRARWVYALCLAFGFGGRYSRDPDERERRLINALRDLADQDEVPRGQLTPGAYSIGGEFARPTLVGLRHIVLRWGAILAVFLLLFSAVHLVFVLRVPGAS